MLSESTEHHSPKLIQAHKPPPSTDFLLISVDTLASLLTSDANAMAAEAPLTPPPPSANDVLPGVLPEAGGAAEATGVEGCERLDSRAAAVSPRAAAAAAAEITEARLPALLSFISEPRGFGDPGDRELSGGDSMSPEVRRFLCSVSAKSRFSRKPRACLM